MEQNQFTEQAKNDLIQIRRFTLDNWGGEQSARYLVDLKQTVQLLSEIPLMGQCCLDDLGKDVYRFPSGSHVIYYLVLSGAGILVIAILHQSMVPGKHLGKRL